MVMHQAIVNADAKIVKGCMIDIFTNIENDVIIGDYCHVSTGAMVDGCAMIAEGAFVGGQSAVNQCVRIERGENDCLIISG